MTARDTTAALALVMCASLTGCERRPEPPSKIGDALRSVGADRFRLRDADIVINAAPASLLASKVYRDLAAELRKLPEDSTFGALPIGEIVRLQTGLDPSIVEAVSLTVRSAGRRFTAAAVLREPVEPARVIEALAGGWRKIDTHGGVDLYAPPGETRGALAFPAAELVVMGSLDELRRGIDNYRAARSGEYSDEIIDLLASAPERADVVVAFTAIDEVVNAARGGPGARGVSLDPLADKFAGVVAAATAGSLLEVAVRMRMSSDEDAADARAGAEQVLHDMRRKLGRELAKPENRPLRELFAAVKVAGAGRAVEVAASLRASMIVRVIELCRPAGAGTREVPVLRNGP